MRPGAMLGIIVAAVVAIVGLVQLDERLMMIGLAAGPFIVLTNAVIVAIARWHYANTRPGVGYVSAEDMIRLERVSLRRQRG